MTIEDDLTGPLTLRYAAHSDRGLVREQNLDAAWAGEGLLAVADGYGPTDTPSISASAIEAMVGARPSPGELLDSLRSAAQRATDTVRELAASDAALANSGTTLTALAWNDSELALVHVGDSRAYLMRNGELLQLTHDDSLVQSLIDSGELTEAEAASHPQRAILIRALSGGDGPPPTVLRQYARPGDRYLLCSDGLHNVLSSIDIRDTLVEQSEPSAAVAELIELVRRAGAPDNVACVVADVVTDTPADKPRE